MLKQKAQDFSFSSILLWKEAYKNIEATRPWEKLKKNLLMFLQILFVFLIILAMLSPYQKKGNEAYANTILIVDNSASMNSLYDGKNTGLEEAKKQAIDYINTLRAGTNITLISCGKEAKVETAQSTDPAEVKRKIKQITKTDLSGDTKNALNLVQSMADQLANCKVVFFTDTPISVTKMDASIVDVYKEGANVSVDFVNHGEDKNGFVVLVKITNHSNQTFTSDVNLYGDDKLLDIKNVVLEAKESKVVYFEDLSFQGTILKAQLQNEDQLLEDNTAYDLMQEKLTERVLLVSKSNVFLEKAVKSFSGISLYKTNDPSNIKKEDSYDLYLFDGMVPDEVPESGNLFYFNTESGLGFSAKGIEKGSILTVAKSKVSTYIEGFQFGVNQVFQINKPDWAQSFLSMDGYSAGFYGEYKGRKVGNLAFDLHETDFALKAEYPILMNHLLNEMLRKGITSEEKYKTGDVVNLSIDSANGALTVKNPMEESIEFPEGETVFNFADTSICGVYTVNQQLKDKKTEEKFLVAFPVNEESEVDRSIEFTSTIKVETGKLNGGRSLVMIIILLGLLVLTLEWAVYLKEQ